MNFLLTFFMLMLLLRALLSPILHNMYCQVLDILDALLDVPKEQDTPVIVIGKLMLLFILFLLLDTCYCFYCFYLLVTLPTWQPGAMLLAVQALTLLLFLVPVPHLSIERAPHRVHPTLLFECFACCSSIYVLSQLL